MYLQESGWPEDVMRYLSIIRRKYAVTCGDTLICAYRIFIPKWSVTKLYVQLNYATNGQNVDVYILKSIKMVKYCLFNISLKNGVCFLMVSFIILNSAMCVLCSDNYVRPNKHVCSSEIKMAHSDDQTNKVTRIELKLWQIDKDKEL